MAAEMPDFLLGGGGGVLGAIATGVALFLRAKFVEKQETKKAGRETSILDRPASDWLRSFLEAMTDDRKEMKELFKELALEIRHSNEKAERLNTRLEGAVGYFQQSHTNLGAALMRVENKTDALLQRRTVP